VPLRTFEQVFHRPQVEVLVLVRLPHEAADGPLPRIDREVDDRPGQRGDRDPVPHRPIGRREVDLMREARDT
jgi:hypothetical protein